MLHAVDGAQRGKVDLVPPVVRHGRAGRLEQDFVQLECCEAGRVGQIGKAAVGQFSGMVATGVVVGAISDDLERFSHASNPKNNLWGRIITFMSNYRLFSVGESRPQKLFFRPQRLFFRPQRLFFAAQAIESKNEFFPESLEH